MKPLVHRKAKRVRTKPVVRHKLHITKGDRVRVIRGGHEPAVVRRAHRQVESRVPRVDQPVRRVQRGRRPHRVVRRGKSDRVHPETLVPRNGVRVPDQVPRIGVDNRLHHRGRFLS